MKILIACEFSGIVREAFKARGHDAWSCDLLPTEIPGQHIQGDVLEILNDGWDMMIGFPPCTRLAASGARWWQGKREEQRQAIIFFLELVTADIPCIAIENPIGIMSGIYRTPDQIIHPWQFGHGETKSTCLWLKNLQRLIPTDIVSVREQRIHKLSALRGPGSSKTRQQDRSRTFPGIAAAMAEQWG
jgi:site-specific DNA-cytosine methylase